MTWFTVGLDSLLQTSLDYCFGDLTEGGGFGSAYNISAGEGYGCFVCDHESFLSGSGEGDGYDEGYVYGNYLLGDGNGDGYGEDGDGESAQ
jgi:hypothetical protein